MKTDKKKLMRKLIAVGLMASMLTANTMTYGSSLILPSINAEALTITETGAKTFNISTMEADPVSEIIEIKITENGTYIFTGTNLRNEGLPNECYIDVQVTVDAGVEANFIFDDCTIVNNIVDFSDNSGDRDLFYDYKSPFVIEGIVNVYIKSASELSMHLNSNYIGRHRYAKSFSGDGIVNIMESEDKSAVLTLSSIKTGELNINGGILDAYSLFSKKLAINDGTVYAAKGYIDTSAISESDYKPVNSMNYTGGNAYLGGKPNDGTTPADSWFCNIGEYKQITDLNGTKLKQTYSVNEDGGSLKAYIDSSHFSASKAPYIVADNDLLVFTDFDDNWFETSVNLGDPAALKITKEYDGTKGFDNQTIVPITMNGKEITPVLTGITVESAEIGEYTATVPFKFTEGETEYTFYYNVPVEITAKEITAKITAKNKVYDKSAEADVEVTFEGLVGTLTEGVDYTITAAFADENVGTGKTVTATITLAETVKNYTLEETTYEATADITAAPLTITGATVENKAYDGEKTANVTEVKLDGVIDGDVVDYTATAEFADEKIGTGKGVTVTVALKNANYALAKATYETTADIIAKGVTIADVVVESKTYDAKTDAKVTSVTFKNEKGEVIPLEYEATAAFADAAAGKGKEVTVTVTLKDSTYTLTESKFTAKADINFAGETKFVSYESVEDKPSLPKADNFVDKEVNGEGLIVVKSPKTETRDYYFAYLVKSEKFKIGNAAPKTGTFYVALNDKGEKTRKFTVSIPFTTVIIDGKTYKAPDGYAYYAFGITDVPTEYDLHCSENIELN